MTPEQFLRRVKEGPELKDRFIRAMTGRQYGAEETANAQAWFGRGWDAARTNVPRLVRWVELQGAVIRALNELALATGLGSDARISKAQLAADLAEQALAAFEKEMENWT